MSALTSRESTVPKVWTFVKGLAGTSRSARHTDNACDSEGT
ncbi:hypothetical protein [Streptomyces oryzae]|nr:hypothetical protein [Streptomyces oryzae]